MSLWGHFHFVNVAVHDTHDFVPFTRKMIFNFSCCKTELLSWFLWSHPGVLRGSPSSLARPLEGVAFPGLHLSTPDPRCHQRAAVPNVVVRKTLKEVPYLFTDCVPSEAITSVSRSRRAQSGFCPVFPWTRKGQFISRARRVSLPRRIECLSFVLLIFGFFPPDGALCV